MLPFLLSGLTFAKNNLKWIVIGLAVIVASYGAYRYTKLVQNYAVAEQVIEQQKQAIADKESQIAKERELNKLTNQIIEEQATQLAQLQEDLKNITANLPEDAAALAPESIRETIRRLRNIK